MDSWVVTTSNVSIQYSIGSTASHSHATSPSSNLTLPESTDVSTSSTFSPSSSNRRTASSHSRKRSSSQAGLESIPSVKKRAKGNQQYSDICEECRMIGLEEALNLDTASLFRNRDGIFIANVGSRFSNGTTSRNCPLCQLLQTPRVNHPGAIELRAFSFLSNFDKVDQLVIKGEQITYDNDLVLLAVVPVGMGLYDTGLHTLVWKSGYVLCQDESKVQPGIFTPRQVQRDFDPAIVKEWIHFCKKNHKKLCGRPSRLVVGLKLINTKSLLVVDAPPRASYVALSYVWGANQGQKDRIVNKIKTRALPTSLPQVVQDAISVSKALGIKFLWIDKYCIDQDSATKHEQISQMDMIYQNAELTIAAVSGEDQNYGLPGVGSRPRSVQPTVKIGNIRVISTMTHPHNAIRSSKWSTRGWTCQEAVLSRRRLIFTDDQMYFDCNAMNCQESISSSLEVLHTKNRSQFQNCLRSGMFGGKGSYEFGHFGLGTLDMDTTFERYFALVEDYTARDLSYDDDSLNAFSGIIRSFSHGKLPILQIWGVPFSILPNAGTDVQEKRHCLPLALSWYHLSGCWNLPQQPRRRSNFPSWSWAGWAGPIGHTLIHNQNFGQFTSLLEDISLEIKPGHIVQYNYLFSNEDSGDFKLDQPVALHFQAFSLLRNRVSVHQDPIQGLIWMIGEYHTAQLFLSRGPKTPGEFIDGLNSGRWSCIYLGRDESWSSLLVVEHHDDFVTRVGFMRIQEWKVAVYAESWDMMSKTKEKFRLV